MADPVICHVCSQPITDPAEQVDRRYKFVRHPAGPRLEGKSFPLRKHHKACDDQFAAEKTHLARIES